MTRRAALAAAISMLLLCAAGCGTEPEHAPAPVLGLQPANDTPQHTIQRLVAAYEQRKTIEYRALFAGDFTYEFSTAADPTLAQQYAAGWFAADESLSAAHLLEGGVTQGGDTLEAAISIALTFAKTAAVGDTSGGRDPARFQVLDTRVDGVMEAPAPRGQTPDTRYVIDNNFHRFRLVRGDAAVGLGPGQPADAGHWYIWNWQDETAMSVAPAREPQPAASTTWSRIKAVYR
jgi:hypothetical protein